ncbi:hypothetical protein HKCCE4037_08355 [Rhodobacterales bacterium HKCCE4037]|nr:hypothetical protein [Rhodobacterales bacterium HKCCE4037]
MRWMIGLAGAIAAVVVLFLMMRGADQHQVRTPVAALDAALAEALARDAEVGILPRVDFTALAIRQEDTRLIVEGRGRWFSIGAGGYTFPDVHLTADAPFEPAFWEVRGNGVGVRAVRLVEAERLAHGSVPAQTEPTANIDWWEDAIGEVFRRADPAGVSEMDLGGFRVDAVELEGPDVVMTLRR